MNRKQDRTREVAPSAPCPEELGRLVAELKRLVVSSRELEKPLSFFHDHLANTDAFMSLGIEASDAVLSQMAHAAARRVLPGFEVTVSLMFQLADHHLWHGALHGSRGEFAAFFYFDDLGVGAMHAVAAIGSTRNHFLRFTGVPVTSPIIPGLVERGQA
jgi:hypothetical protein